MRVFLDESPCEVPTGTLSQAIAGAAAVAERRGRTIVEVMVDGERWTPAEFDAPAAAARPAAEVRLTTAEPAELVRQTFAEASLVLDDADRLQQDAAALLQGGKIVKAMEQLQQAIDIWMSVQQAVLLGCAMAEIKLEAPGEAAQADRENHPRAVINALGVQLRSVRSALSSGDTAALADALLYDLPQVVLDWRAMLSELASRIGSERQ